MKKSSIEILLVLFLSTLARADTPLVIGDVPPGSPGGPCYDDTLIVQNPPHATGTFTLNGVSGTGTVSSGVTYVADNIHGQDHMRYGYSVDMSGMPAATNHCVRLLVHFGTPHGCTYDVLQFTGSGVVPLLSASEAVHGDITFTFGSGCLSPGQASSGIGMISDAQPKTGYVTIIDDYNDPAGGLPQESRINVTAIVPDVPPNWAYAPTPLPFAYYQGILYTNMATNSIPMKTNLDGPYDFTLGIYDAASNGLPVGPVITQSVQVVHGLFNLLLPYEPAAIDWGDRWVDIGVRPTGSNGGFSKVGRQAITPTPQALYAYSAGVVSDLSPGQAVTSLNGLTDGVNLQAGGGIVLDTNGNTLTISAQPGTVSDRSLKTDFAPVSAEKILARVVGLPISSWRYTNETASVRHVGPMAQDFRAAFGLGHDDKFIEFVDEEGVALTAIQGLNEKIQKQNAELEQKQAEITDLKQRLEKLEQIINAREGGTQ